LSSYVSEKSVELLGVVAVSLASSPKSLKPIVVETKFSLVLWGKPVVALNTCFRASSALHDPDAAAQVSMPSSS
jgi:hypothetical protein